MISLVSHPDYDIPLPDGHRFPATKFSRLVSRLNADGIVGQFVPLQPEPVNPMALSLTQDAGYIDAIANGTLDRESQRVLGLTWS